MDDLPAAVPESVAVIGLRGRFPGANNVEELWQRLCAGEECLVTLTEEQLRQAGVDAATMRLPGFVPRGGLLSDIEMFDAQFFGFSPRDAEVLDPQQRLFLECAYECLESAGYNPEAYPGLIGVYGGSDQSTYLYQLYAHGARYLSAPMASIGNDKDYLTTLTSYKLNLRGPSIAVQTACSTSLVAVALACQALLNYQCDMALAGGVCVQVPHTKGYFYELGGIVSPDGHCRTFDAAGQGTVVGNGVGLVLLKRLSEALAEGDEVYAVIKGAALNNDGALKVGFGAPSVEGQAQVITMAQAMAGADPESIEYVEAHGTATLLGDPIEMAALGQVFSAATRKRQYCAIGSLKSNVGHLASAAGVAGLIKAVLCLRHEQIPPSLHFNKPNPQINFASSPFFVNTKLREWRRRDGQPRRAGVSSFGVGGTNAHVVLEEAPRREPSGRSRPYQVLLLSTKTASALEAATDNLGARLDRNPELSLADVAYTLQVGRKEYRYRRALVCPHDDPRTAAAALRERNWQYVQSGESETKDRPVVFMFSGQGSQYVNMGFDLYEIEPTFRAQMDLCAECLKPHLGLDLRDVLYPSDELGEQMTAALTRTSLAQPALFSLEYSLARLWMEWGIVPKAMIGHSIGEYVAACLAGVFTLEEALAAVAYRGYLMAQMPEGAMLAVPMPEKDLLPLLGAELALAAVNGGGLSVASGPFDAIDILENRLRARGIEGRRLHTSHAFHSQMMEPAVAPFVEAMRAIQLKPPQIRYFSNLTGTWATPELVTDPEYWGHHLRHTVRFFDHLQELFTIPEVVYLEVGPGQTLCTLTRQAAPKGGDQLILPSIRPVHEKQHDGEFLLKALSRLWLGGVPLNWTGFSMHERRRRVPLPTYPFEKQRYWVDPPDVPTSSIASAAHPPDVSTWFYVPTWKPALAAARNGRGADPGSRWMIFSLGDDLGEALGLRLVQEAADVVTVFQGEKFEKLGPGLYRICPGERKDYEALIADLKSAGPMPDHIAHLWAAGPVPDPGQELALFDWSQQAGFYSLLFLAQALDSHRVTQRIQIGVVTRGLYSIVGGEALFPPRNTVIGAAKTLPQEFPNLRCRLVDLDAADSEQNTNQIIAELAREPFACGVVYRNGRRWVQTYEPLRLDQAFPEQIPLREGGVYLITGGLGKLGLTLAEYLTREWKARVVLSGRSAFPAREEWPDWIVTQGETDSTSRKIRRLMAMEEAGGEVLVLAADCANREQMAEVINQTFARFGALNGIIHGAGATSADSFGPAKEVDAAQGDKQFRPKVYGIHVLEEVLAGQQLDFWVLLSSLSAVLGGLGLTAYASANTYLDAVGSQRNQEGSAPWIVTNWDAWLFPEDLALGAAHDPNAITPAAGVEAFRRILSAGSRHIVVSTTDLQERLDKWVSLTTLEDKGAKKAADAGLHSRPNLSTEYAAPRTDVEKTVADVWQEILGVAPVGVYDKFFELGGHSLLAVQLIAQLRDAFQVELSAQRLFEAPTIAQLAETIEGELHKVRAQEEQREQEHLAELLEMVENLTDEQVRELLARESTSLRGMAAHGQPG